MSAAPGSSKSDFEPDDRWVPANRRWFGLDKATFLPAAVVAAIAVLMAVILPAIDDRIGYDDNVVAGDILELSGGVTFVPSVGWGITSGVRDNVGTPATGYPRDAAVEDGGVAFSVRTGPFTGDSEALLEQIKDTNDALGSDFRITEDPVAIRTDDGTEGVIARFSNPQVDGVIAAFSVDGLGIQVVGTAPLDYDESDAEELAAMIASINVRTEGET
ncbi:hypothetical protein VZC37_16470 [Gordonia sp. LSe1-13]|uniref:DUF4245 domain-containing protein n=1 Tax=Gordonia sesuvii TaxID=3116777 RepID=A0ABU7MGL1_9ACTN|nr:hypothetical protein [Gordonia sp. LSe1-13]